MKKSQELTGVVGITARKMAEAANASEKEMIPSPGSNTVLGRAAGSMTAIEIEALDLSPYVESKEEWMFLRINSTIRDNPVSAYQLSGLPVARGEPIEEQVKAFMEIPRIRQALRIMELRTNYLEKVICQNWIVEKLIGAMIQAECLGEITPQISAISKIAEIRGLNAPTKIEITESDKKEKERLERARREVEALMAQGEKKPDTIQEIIAQAAEIVGEENEPD